MGEKAYGGWGEILGYRGVALGGCERALGRGVGHVSRVRKRQERRCGSCQKHGSTRCKCSSDLKANNGSVPSAQKGTGTKALFKSR